jgi:nitrate/nitrite-specific signal transduction histidine kinase
MAKAQKFRGSGVRLTLPYIMRFSALWLLVTTLAILVFALTLYLVLAERMSDGGQQRLMLVLGLQTLCLLGGVFALAVFTTHRLAGPLIAIRRALASVRDGKLDGSLRFRSVDPHLGDIADTFNEMVVALRSRSGNAENPPGGEPPANF